MQQRPPEPIRLRDLRNARRVPITLDYVSADGEAREYTLHFRRQADLSREQEQELVDLTQSLDELAAGSVAADGSLDFRGLAQKHQALRRRLFDLYFIEPVPDDVIFGLSEEDVGILGLTFLAGLSMRLRHRLVGIEA